MANDMNNQPATPQSITFEQFTESTMAAVLRATAARKLPNGPIIIGVIWTPQGLPGIYVEGATRE